MAKTSKKPKEENHLLSKKNLIDKIMDWIKSHDMFGFSTPPFFINGSDSVPTLLGGILSLGIKFIVTLFLMGKFNEMIFYSDPKITQLLI